MKSLKGKRVLLTGAGAGIGRCTAMELAKAGAELVLTDVNAKSVEETAALLREKGATVYARACDVSKKREVDEVAKWVETKIGPLDVLINNAGIGHSAELVETSIAQWKRLMDVNFWGPLYHVYAFLPAMKKRGNGHIVNVSSGQAFFRLPTWGAYATIKLASGAFSELLGVEARKYGIDVTTVYPFMVNTGFYDGIEGETWAARMSMKLVPYYSMSPERVARILVKAIRKNKRIEMVSLLNDVGYYTRLVPPLAGLVSQGTNWLLAKAPEKGQPAQAEG